MYSQMTERSFLSGLRDAAAIVGAEKDGHGTLNQVGNIKSGTKVPLFFVKTTASTGEVDFSVRRWGHPRGASLRVRWFLYIAAITIPSVYIKITELFVRAENVGANIVRLRGRKFQG